MLALGGVALLAVIGIGAALAFGGGDDGSDATRGARGGRLHALCQAGGARRRQITPTSRRRTASRRVEHGSADERAALRSPASAAPTTSRSTGQLVHNLEHGAIAIQYGDERPGRDRAAAEGFLRRPSRGGRSSRRIQALESRSRSGPGSREGATKPRRTRQPRTCAKCPDFDESGLRRLLRCVPVPGPGAVPARHRSYPAATSTRYLRAGHEPGWRNWSDAVGLKPTVPRDMRVRVPAPALLLFASGNPPSGSRRLIPA